MQLNLDQRRCWEREFHQQAQTALVLLERMRPQGRKPVGIWPAWSAGRY